MGGRSEAVEPGSGFPRRRNPLRRASVRRSRRGAPGVGPLRHEHGHHRGGAGRGEAPAAAAAAALVPGGRRHGLADRQQRRLGGRVRRSRRELAGHRHRRQQAGRHHRCGCRLCAVPEPIPSGASPPPDHRRHRGGGGRGAPHRAMGAAGGGHGPPRSRARRVGAARLWGLDGGAGRAGGAPLRRAGTAQPERGGAGGRGRPGAGRPGRRRPHPVRAAGSPLDRRGVAHGGGPRGDLGAASFDADGLRRGCQEGAAHQPDSPGAPRGGAAGQPGRDLAPSGASGSRSGPARLAGSGGTGPHPGGVATHRPAHRGERRHAGGAAAQ